ncbi:MAG: TolC family protein, partial [Gemmataceae bacterium]
MALRLAGVDNPTVNLARERVREALAVQLAARALLLPSVNIGGNFYLHRGNLQASSGLIRDVDRPSLYLGAGARAVGTGTVTVPGVWLFAHLGDAMYEPLAARQRVAASRSDAQAVQNVVLRDVAAGYLRLAGAEARLDVLRQGETDVAEVVRLTRVYAEKGQGR